MRLGEGVEWALHCCTLLAALPEGAALPGAKLAEYHGVPAAYLAKHLAALANAGIVESSVGRHGGYRLARPPAEVTVLDVVTAVDGADPLFVCTEIRRRGPAACPPEAYRAPCSITAAMRRAEEAWRRELAGQTLADLVQQVAANAPPAALELTVGWMQGSVRAPGGPAV